MDNKMGPNAKVQVVLSRRVQVPQARLMSIISALWEAKVGRLLRIARMWMSRVGR